ncbi:hypothetical protein IE53DRAFT_37432 [Violaceomyces palustris]|uniref:Uncharacterized protein n=1 Tax=Violaceomyces palustris TaxID=1673888 RepID=A0ACD0P1E6_9BASI|nr:hypothetical protein IE53DRAFT_37432 [Violaceomyces palustris]
MVQDRDEPETRRGITSSSLLSSCVSLFFLSSSFTPPPLSSSPSLRPLPTFSQSNLSKTSLSSFNCPFILFPFPFSILFFSLFFISCSQTRPISQLRSRASKIATVTPQNDSPPIASVHRSD